MEKACSKAWPSGISQGTVVKGQENRRDRNCNKISQPFPCSAAAKAHEDKDPGRAPKEEVSQAKPASTASIPLPHA